MNKCWSFYLKGKGHQCNVCGKEFRHFLSKGNGLISRKNAVCPHCGSLERTRLLYAFLQNETPAFETQIKVLHFAPERGLRKKWSKNKNYLDADINPLLATREVDIQKMDFLDEQFEMAIVSHVLGHVEDDSQAISELYRILKKGGNAIVLSLLNQQNDESIEDEKFTTEKERLENYGEKTLLRLYGQSDLKKRLEKVGFTVEIVDYREHFSMEDQQRLSLGNGERELIYVAKK